MRIMFSLAAAVILSAATMPSHAGCMRCGPIFNIADAPATSASGKALSKDEVKNAIVRAGAALGWQMKADAPGRITATLNVRKHTAVIEIPYSAKSYSINYKSSVNLDEGGGEIHNNYNGWIKNLAKGINAQLSATGT
jgi:hypothetical protein